MKDMNYNYDILEDRIIDTLSKTDLQTIRDTILSMKGNTLTVGVGGSKAVSNFASKVISSMNNTIATSVEPRDFEHMDKSQYSDAMFCSYSGKTKGLNQCFNNNLRKTLLTGGDIEYPKVKSLFYNSDYPKEESFISIGSTLVPMSVLLSVYNGVNSKEIIHKMFAEAKKLGIDHVSTSRVYDIFSGIDTETPEQWLESTLVESGIGDPILHHKYDFCHGRYTSLDKRNSNLIYLISNPNNLDKVILEELNKKRKVITLNGKFGDPIWNNYFLTLQTMLLAKSIAEHEEVNLSRINYEKELTKRLYYYDSEL